MINKKVEKSELKDEKYHSINTSEDIDVNKTRFHVHCLVVTVLRPRQCTSDDVARAIPIALKKGKTTNVQSHLSEEVDNNNLVSQPGVIDVMQNAKLPVSTPPGGCRFHKSP